MTCYTYMCLPLGCFFAKFGIVIGEFSSEMKGPEFKKLGTFLLKMVYRWMGNWAKNWYRESQIFEVRQAHPRMI